MGDLVAEAAVVRSTGVRIQTSATSLPDLRVPGGGRVGTFRVSTSCARQHQESSEI